MNLWINFYLNPSRNYELFYCLQNNIDNPLIDKIYIIGEINYDDNKIVFIKSDKRPTFKDFIRQINYHARYNPNEINIIANADIYFDETLELAKGMGDNECYALSRWDETQDGLKLFDTRDSQDAWLLKGGLDVDNCDFTNGKGGCDNAIADRFQQAGYKVSNPSKDIRAIHVHKNNHTWWVNEERVPIPYLLITPHALGEEPNTQRITVPYF